MDMNNHPCDLCKAVTPNLEDAYGEFVCDDCLQNMEEAAYERYYQAFHDGGSVQFKSLQQQQIEARRIK